MRSCSLIVAVVGAIVLSSWSIAADAAPPRRDVHRPGHPVKVLPPRHSRIVVAGHPYFYHDGVFYQRRDPGFVIVNAPIGARVSRLPAGYLSFGIGTRRYFYFNTTYYLWNDRYRDYVVVRKPSGADGAIEASKEVASVDIYVYPREGQTEEQRDQDRYECHRWAREQTGFDPSQARQDTGLAPDYRRAITACLEGRGYTVK